MPDSEEFAMSYTVGVIGCGMIAPFHFSALEKIGASVRWISDLNQELATPWCNRFGARYTPNYRDIFHDPAVQAVHVLTYTGLHREICLAAIEAGKAVVCEKTLARSGAEAFEIVSAALRRRVPFYTSYMKRFIPAVEKARELLPKIGPVVSSYFRSYQKWGPVWGPQPSSGFFHKPPDAPSEVIRRYGGGMLPMGGSHILDLILFLLGRPFRLAAWMVEPPDRDYDLQATAILETANGPVHFEALAHPLERIGFWKDGWDERFEINGLQGRLELYSAPWNDVTHKASLLVHYDNQTGCATEYRFAPVSPFERAIARFAPHIARGVQGEQSALTGWEVDHLIDHIRLSAREKQMVTISWNEPHP